MNTFKILEELRQYNVCDAEHAKASVKAGTALADLYVRFVESGPVRPFPKTIDFLERVLTAELFDCYTQNFVVSSFKRRARELAEAEGYEIVNGEFVYDRAHEAYLKWLESKEAVNGN